MSAFSVTEGDLGGPDDVAVAEESPAAETAAEGETSAKRAK